MIPGPDLPEFLATQPFDYLFSIADPRILPLGAGRAYRYAD